MLQKVLVTTIAIMLPYNSFAAEKTCSLKVSVQNFKNDKGFLKCALFKGPEGFPMSYDKGGVIQIQSKIQGNKSLCIFENVAANKKIGIGLFHDENENNKMDTNFVGIPTEGYGASNNVLPKLSAPKWDDSQFSVSCSQNVEEITIKLKY